MSEPHREHDTLEAIKRLQSKYPFATGLLIYCLIERMLKCFAIQEIDNAQSILCAKFRYSLREKRDKGQKQLLTRLKDLGINEIALKFDKTKAEKEAEFFKSVSNRRNDYMHSNNLFPPKVKIDKKERSAEHKEHLHKAIQDLQLTFNYLRDEYEIIIDNNENFCELRQK